MRCAVAVTPRAHEMGTSTPAGKHVTKLRRSRCRRRHAGARPRGANNQQRVQPLPPEGRQDSAAAHASCAPGAARCPQPVRRWAVHRLHQQRNSEAIRPFRPGPSGPRTPRHHPAPSCAAMSRLEPPGSSRRMGSRSRTVEGPKWKEEGRGEGSGKGRHHMCVRQVVKMVRNRWERAHVGANVPHRCGGVHAAPACPAAALHHFFMVQHRSSCDGRWPRPHHYYLPSSTATSTTSSATTTTTRPYHHDRTWPAVNHGAVVSSPCLLHLHPPPPFHPSSPPTPHQPTTTTPKRTEARCNRRD